MDPQAKELLANTPEHPMRSRLEPHRDLIRELRRKRYPYRKIALILQDQFAIRTSKSALHQFVKVRSRNSDQRRLQFTIPPAPTSLAHSKPQAQLCPDPQESAILGMSSVPSAAQREPLREQAANRGTRSPAIKRFSFDPAAGLTLSDEDLNLKPKKD